MASRFLYLFTLYANTEERIGLLIRETRGPLSLLGVEIGNPGVIELFVGEHDDMKTYSFILIDGLFRDTRRVANAFDVRFPVNSRVNQDHLDSKCK